MWYDKTGQLIIRIQPKAVMACAELIIWKVGRGLYACFCRCVLWVDNLSVFKMNGAVSDSREILIVGDDDEGLAEFVAQVEEKLMELGFVLRVE